MEICAVTVKTTNGNVGIGMTTPLARRALDIKGLREPVGPRETGQADLPLLRCRFLWPKPMKSAVLSGTQRVFCLATADQD